MEFSYFQQNKSREPQSHKIALSSPKNGGYMLPTDGTYNFTYHPKVTTNCFV